MPEKKKEEFSKSNLIIIFAIVALLLSIYTKGFSTLGLNLYSRSIPEEEIKEKILSFIKNELVTEGVSVEVKEVTKENNLYKIQLVVADQEYTSYANPDLSLFFPQGMPLSTTSEVAGAATGSTPREIPKSDNPEVHLYVMSFCPYGNQAEDIMKPVVELLGNSVKVEPHYVFYEQYSSGYPDYCLDEEEKYCSMHGINELNQGIREICVYNSQPEKFWSFVEEVNNSCNVDNVEKCWEDAAKKTGVDANTVSKCQTEKAEEYAAQEKDLTTKYQVSGSPSLIINGVPYSGSRSPEAYKNAICGAFNTPPDACGQVLESSTSSTSGACE